MYKLTHYATFTEDDGTQFRVYDEDVYQHVKKHSTIFDRLNPRKMLEMSFLSFMVLSKSCDEPKGNYMYFRTLRHRKPKYDDYSQKSNVPKRVK